MRHLLQTWLFKSISALFLSSFILNANANPTIQSNPETITDHYAKISDDVSLYYQEAGTGPVLLFIPGWTMSSDIFKAQIQYFSEKYHVIAMDPRSQGRSTITLENNDYGQHGKDLVKFINKLELKNITLIGWSWGCLDAYSYIRLQGVDNLHAFVCIDLSPKASVPQGQWGDSYESWGASVFQPFMYNRYQYTQTWMQSIVDHPLTPQELNYLTAQSMRTPTYAAIQEAADAVYSDYRPEALLLEKDHIPTLNFLSANRAPSATKWLKANQPDSKIKVMSKHLMFWEHPNEFNQTLDEFLSETYPNSEISFKTS